MNVIPVKARLRRLGALVAVAALASFALAAPSAAATPDRFGFVLYSGGAVVPSGTFPAATTVTVTGTGRYTIDFVGQGAPGGVAHITAINPSPHFCQINSFAPSVADEMVMVSCFKAGGSPDASNFSAIFDRSSGTASPGYFGYVDSKASGSLISTYNSVGGTNTVAHTATGAWTVTMPGLSTPGPVDGGIQATAVQLQKPARCKVLGWASGPNTGQAIQINCYNAAGAPLDTEFTVTYQYQRSLNGGVAPPKFFGYLWNTPPIGPVSTNFNSQAGPGTNSLTPPGTPFTQVTFPALAVLPNDVQVTAYGPGSAFCDMINPWGTVGTSVVVKVVGCYDNAGTAVNSGFLISDTSRS